MSERAKEKVYSRPKSPSGWKTQLPKWRYENGWIRSEQM